MKQLKQLSIIFALVFLVSCATVPPDFTGLPLLTDAIPVGAVDELDILISIAGVTTSVLMEDVIKTPDGAIKAKKVKVHLTAP